MGRADKTAVIAGGGPAGLTAAYELASRSTQIQPVVFEESSMLGGISRTEIYKGNHIDIGGHRFFSKSQRVKDFWEKIMPLQDSPSKDEILLEAKPNETDCRHNPETEDRVMLKRRRVSRIYYLNKFFDYPVSLTLSTLRALGFKRTLKAGMGYLFAQIKKKPETTLENFYINRFGEPLYKMFFEDYTEKVWGKHPSQLGADWGSQRIKGLSIFSILKNIFSKRISSNRDSSKIETSLIEEFLYPKYGPGQLWETVAKDAEKEGATIILDTCVKKLHLNSEKRIEAVTVEHSSGEQKRISCDYFLSSMPIKDLVSALEGIEIPTNVKEVASALPYRDFITVGLLVNKLKIKNQTRIKTFNERIPDTWIYVQDRGAKLGRIQIFNNWSPYLVKDFENTEWIGLEYFCNEEDSMWNVSDIEFIEMAIKELVSIGIIEQKDVIDAVRIKTRKAYPAYYGSYYQLDIVKDFLNEIPNLYCIGRNGQHRYNNMDHSMLTAMEAVDAILTGNNDRTALWNVNAEKDYHES